MVMFPVPAFKKYMVCYGYADLVRKTNLINLLINKLNNKNMNKYCLHLHVPISCFSTIYSLLGL